jgi:hypothetical protein
VFTRVNSLSLQTKGVGDVFINQGSQLIKLNNVEVADGAFTVVAAGAVDLVNVRSLSNDEANDIRVTAAGDVFVRSVVAGLYAADASQAPVVLNSSNAVVANTSLTSLGDVFLTSTGGRVLETFVDDEVDVVADVLTIEAALGITGMELALNTLDVRTNSGDITLFEVDGYLEKSKGLDVLRAVITTPTAGADDVSLTVQGELRVGRTAVSVAQPGYSGLIKGDAIRLESQNDSVSVLRPASGEALVYTRGIGFDAAAAGRFLLGCD